MKEKVCVLIRVYDRIEDLELNLDIIKKTWRLNDYYIIVSSNGKSHGFSLSDKVYAHSDRIIELEYNAGHLKGNSQLLMEGVKCIPNDCQFTVLLEADNWLFTDELISKYISENKKQGAVWASARWYDRFYSNATDFAVVKTDFLRYNMDVVNFNDYPECWVSNYLKENNAKCLYIKELMPVSLPGYIKKYPFAPRGRFYIFPRGRMVTHHIEDIRYGIEEKKFYFNVVSKSIFFETNIRKNMFIERLKIKTFILLSTLFVRRSWYSKRKKLIVASCN